jgi:NCAIR mutase (PurE)-related protein
MNRERIEEVLTALSKGELTVTDALERLRILPYEDLVFAKLDHHRDLRKGIPEAIYTPGKTVDQLVEITRKALDRGGEAIFTRMTPEVHERLRAEFGDKVRWYSEARILTAGTSTRASKGRVLVVTAGTSDIPVAEEAAVTSAILGCDVDRLYDVGVAGVHRLTSNRKQFETADVIIVVAGMEGALPSVVAGMTDRPVVAVPTSVGYGASFGGIAALLGMLSSCSSGIGVVNIDNGFGAGALAAIIVNNKYSRD